MASKPTKAIEKKRTREPKISYIVGATGPDFTISDADTDLAMKQRAKDHICQRGDDVVVNGRRVTNEVGGDLHMQRQIMHYMATRPVEPAKQPPCLAFAHTGPLTCKVKSTQMLRVHDDGFGGPSTESMARVLNFDSDALLKEIFEQEDSQGGYFASFSQRKEKTMRVAANTYKTTDVVCDGSTTSYFYQYFVELDMLTPFDVFTATGELVLDRNTIEFGKKEYTAHINWRKRGWGDKFWSDGHVTRVPKERGYPFEW